MLSMSVSSNKIPCFFSNKLKVFLSIISELFLLFCFKKHFKEHKPIHPFLIQPVNIFLEVSCLTPPTPI